MKKRDLANILTEQMELPRSKSAKAVNLIFESIHDQLRRGRQVSITGFGVFEMDSRNTRGAGVGQGKKAVFKASKSLGQEEVSG